jgi:LysM repeat protein
MQSEEFKITAKDRLQKKVLICVNSLLCVLSLTVILMIACQSDESIQYQYTVQSGDTLGSIAEISGLKASRIQSYNELDDTELISGQVLFLPGVSRLKRGEKLQQINITTRNQWKAEKADAMKNSAPYNRITIHHTTDNPKYPKRDNALFARVIQKYHQQSRKWADIGYHFLVAKNGEILEGRLLNKLGAHVKNQNTGNIGIAMLGDFDRDEMTSKQKEVLKSLIRALQERYDIPANQLYGHRDLGDTNCPGKNGWTFIQTLKAQ